MTCRRATCSFRAVPPSCGGCEKEPSGLPVKMYQTAERLTVAAPMPGLEPADITVRITAEGTLELRGKRRGPRQDDMDLLLDEWSVGPYERTLSLPCHVDGELADVT